MKFLIFLIFFSGNFSFSQKPYRGAEYRTIDEFLYGRFEVRMKTATGSGVVSSFFTIDDYWADGQSSTSNWREIDFEALGNLSNSIQTNIITAYETHHEELISIPFYPYDTFNIYAFEWTPNNIKFFVNDQLVREDENQYVSTHNTSQKIMMNIWQPIWEDWVGEFDDSILPVYAYYDWVKYYSYTPGEGLYGSNYDFSFNWEDNFDYFNNQVWQKATHTWSANNAQFVEQNSVMQDGFLILCLTDNNSYGYSGGDLNIQSLNFEDDLTLSIKPNPFNSSFVLNILNAQQKTACQILLYNIKGHKVFHESEIILNGELNVDLRNEAITSGLYLGVLKMDGTNQYFKITYLR